jgi:nucleotide-binding universal stress UspA family protein
MSYATLLLHLDDGPHAAARIDMGIHLACRFESHLVGVSASGNASFKTSAGAALLGRDQLAGALAAGRRLAEDRSRHFLERARASGVPSCEALVDDRDDGAAIVHHGLCSDLVILGQPDPRQDDHGRARAQFEQALLDGAPPALVLPHDGLRTELGCRVLVAWNDSREAARAIAAAMPLLRRAEQVHVVQCDSPLERLAGADAERPRIERVREWLVRNGVAADAWLCASDTDAGSALLTRARECGADLIVMGAWGRSRWSERVFGGATRTMLARMTVPVLMAR